MENAAARVGHGENSRSFSRAGSSWRNETGLYTEILTSRRNVAGERLFLDYAGDGVPVVIDRLTGEIRMAQIFVAVLGASSFTYARATWTQTLADWIDAHTHAFAAIGGVPHLLVPDNTKAAVIKACLYQVHVESHLCRNGGALRYCHFAGEAKASEGQGKS